MTEDKINNEEPLIEENSKLLSDKLDEGESYGVFENGDNLLSFSIDKLYTNSNETKFRNRLAMRKEPPVLDISSSDGVEVSVPLTLEFVKSLLRVLNDVNFAYLGMRKTKKKINLGDNDGSFFVTIKNLVKNNRLSIIQLFFGMLLGISVAKNFLIGVVLSLLLSLVALVINFSERNNAKEETIDNSEEIEEDIV